MTKVSRAAFHQQQARPGRTLPSVRALMTMPSAERLLLIFLASSSV
jgi:hypothetical protein